MMVIDLEERSFVHTHLHCLCEGVPVVVRRQAILLLLLESASLALLLIDLLIHGLIGSLLGVVLRHMGDMEGDDVFLVES